MTDLWYPGAVRNPAPENLWGNYRDDDRRWKYVLHTTEAKLFTPHPSDYYGHTFYPHATIGSRIWQHIPINRAARALKHPSGTAETNADYAVQVEIVWKAAEIGQLPDAVMDRVRAFGQWVVEQTGMAWESTVHFAGPEEHPAGVNAKQRMKPPVWDLYEGVCGHQHVPNNDHWDPGSLDITKLLGALAPPGEEEEMKQKFLLTPDGNGVIAFGYNETTRAASLYGKVIATPDEFNHLVDRGWLTPYNPANHQERMDQPTFDFLTRGSE